MNVLLTFFTILSFYSSAFAKEAVKRVPSRIDSDLILQNKVGACFSRESTEISFKAPFILNHQKLTRAESKNILWIKECVLPFLPGSLKERVEWVSQVTWWTLREGALGLSRDSLFRYSVCHEFDPKDQTPIEKRVKKDVNRGLFPDYLCLGKTWQVGIASVQVPNLNDKAIKNIIQKIFHPDGDSGITETSILRWTFRLAGYEDDSEVSKKIVLSKGALRRSWFLRNPLIGFMAVRAEVVNECILQSKPWCWTTGYRPADLFGKDSQTMKSVIKDLNKMYLN